MDFLIIKITVYRSLLLGCWASVFNGGLKSTPMEQLLLLGQKNSPMSSSIKVQCVHITHSHMLPERESPLQTQKLSSKLLMVMKVGVVCILSKSVWFFLRFPPLSLYIIMNITQVCLYTCSFRLGKPHHSSRGPKEKKIKLHLWPPRLKAEIK